jgi:photosystem II stability/assembly factor-like uncharacterized protein
VLGLALLGLAAGLAAQEPTPSPSPTPTPHAEPVITSLTLFAGTSEGLYRTRDWGGSWQPVIAHGDLHGLERAGAVRDIVALGPWVYAGANGGVYISEDFGENWKRTETGAPVLRVLPSRYPMSDLTVFAGTTSGLLKSVDAGRTFAPTAVSGVSVSRIEWPGPTLVLGTSRGVMVSPDGGTTFNPPAVGLPAGDVRALALSSFYAADPVLFAGVGASGVFRSSDGGKTWQEAGLQGQSVTDLAWLGPFLYAVSETGMSRSEDLGRTWTHLTKTVAQAPTRVLFPLMPASGSEIFLGTVGGVYRSPDGGLNWQASGLSDLPVLCLGTFPQADPVKPKKK